MPSQDPFSKLSTQRLVGRVFGIPRGKAELSLLQAAKHGDEVALRKALDAGCNPSGMDEHGRSALQLAASSGCTEIFAMLIEAGAVPSCVTPPPSFADAFMLLCRLLNWTLILFVCGWLASLLYVPLPAILVQNTGRKILAHLIAIPMSAWLVVQITVRAYPTVLEHARLVIEALSTFQGDTGQMLALFLDAEPKLSREDEVALWAQAADRGYTEICQRLLQRGFPVDTWYGHHEYPDVTTALLNASGASHPELVTFLLSKGADPGLLDNHGRSCLHLAAAQPYTRSGTPEKESDSVIELLLQTDAIKHINTRQRDDDPAVEDPTLPGRHGWPLADATQGRVNAVRMLLEAGADPNVRDDSGWTALHAACRWHAVESVTVVRLLVQYGADVNAVSEHNWTPLGCASSIGTSLEMVEVLVDAGAELESTAGEGVTALQIAARHDVSGGKIATFLAKSGADVNASGLNKWGSPLLATLARPGMLPEQGRSLQDARESEILEFLIEFLTHGLDVNLVPDGRPCALQVAAENNLPAVISFLLEHGARLPPLEQNTVPVPLGVDSPSHSRDSIGNRRAVFRTSILSFVAPYCHDVFKVLLGQEASSRALNVDSALEWEMTILGKACTSRDRDFLETATLLLDHGADPDFLDLRGHRAIQHAAYAVTPGHLMSLIEHGASLLPVQPNQEDDDDDEWGTLLHSLCKGYAAQVKHVKTTDDEAAFFEAWRLLEPMLPDGSAWLPDASGRTCLHYLAETAEETRVVLKVDRSSATHTSSPVIPMMQEVLGRPCLTTNGATAGQVNHPPPSPEVVLIANKDGQLSFHILASRGDVEAMAALVTHIRVERDAEALASALLTRCDNRGWNALHYAASEGRGFACYSLLESAEDAVMAMTNEGESAADLANGNGHHIVAEYISSWVDARAGVEGAAQRAEAALARAVKKQLVYEVTEDELMEAITERAESLRRVGA